jgi:hypothetical protein
MYPHLPRRVANTLTDRSVLEHRVIKTEDEFVLIVRTRSRDARKLRRKLEADLLNSGAPATVVLSSSARQEFDVSKWHRDRPPAVRVPLKIGSYLLA